MCLRHLNHKGVSFNELPASSTFIPGFRWKPGVFHCSEGGSGRRTGWWDTTCCLVGSSRFLMLHRPLLLLVLRGGVGGIPGSIRATSVHRGIMGCGSRAQQGMWVVSVPGSAETPPLTFPEHGLPITGTARRDEGLRLHSDTWFQHLPPARTDAPQCGRSARRRGDRRRMHRWKSSMAVRGRCRPCTQQREGCRNVDLGLCSVAGRATSAHRPRPPHMCPTLDRLEQGEPRAEDYRGR